MGAITRYLERGLVFVIGIAVIWLIATDVFLPLDRRLPVGLAIAITYFLAAYLIIPRVIRMTQFLHRKHIPRYTVTGDGLPGDPVFIVLIGSERELRSAFRDAGWVEGEKLSLKSGWLMFIRFLTNTPYPHAPFSSLYLFARRQDFGFQQQIGNSPRKRHHVRFWGASTDPQIDPQNTHYWTKPHAPDAPEKTFWIGAGTKDTGLGFAKLTYQVTHSVDREIDQERDYIFQSLKAAGRATGEKYFDPGQEVFGKFISDGRILTARLSPSPDSHI